MSNIDARPSKEITVADAGGRRRDMTQKLLVFGSVLTRGSAAGDIDILVAEFMDERMYEAVVDLRVYEYVAHATGKPVDVFFSRYRDDFNIAGFYDPAERERGWRITSRFCGKYFFLGASREVEVGELIELALHD
jgi:hypothetical protein